MAFFPLAHVRFLSGRRAYIPPVWESYPVDAANGSPPRRGAPHALARAAAGKFGRETEPLQIARDSNFAFGWSHEAVT
jgi:hypothetical protein